LEDLLKRLLVRNAKDRMDFDDFFSHPFLRALTSCDKLTVERSNQTQNSSRKIALVPDKLANQLHPHERVSRIKEDNLKNLVVPKQKEHPQPRSPKYANDYPNSSLANTGVKSNESDSSSSENFDDFVMINDDVSTPTASTPVTTASSSLPQRILNRTLRPLVNYALPEPLPVPTQRAAYEQIQRSSGSNSSSIGVIQESDSESVSTVNIGNNSVTMTSPPATPPQNTRFLKSGNPIPSPPASLNLKRQDSCSSIGSAESGCSRGSRNMLITDVSQMSPPSVNFVLGSSPTMPSPMTGMVASPNSSSYGMNRSRRLSVPHSPNPGHLSPQCFNW